MSKKPILLFCQPDDSYFLWQCHTYIESCLENGFDEERIQILLYTPPERVYNTAWDQLKKIYPKIGLYNYEDKGVGRFLGTYIPILRPHILWQHFEKFPELEKETIIYTDCDIVWTKPPDIEKFYDDDVHYMSNASGYMNNSYFERKNNEVLPEKKHLLKDRDFLKEIASFVGITKDIVIENNENIGGVQYILKNMNADFWKKVETDCLVIRAHLLNVNKQFYASENAGIQSWCADLWAVIFNLWYRGDTVKIVPEMTFAWSSDSIEKLDKVSILHNAGIAGDFQGDIPVFHKGKYFNNTNPFKDLSLYDIYNNDKNKTLCNNEYIKYMLKAHNKHQLIF